MAHLIEAWNYRNAARDALYFYDRVAGNVPDEHGWTASDIKRLAEIRALVSNAG